MICSRCGREVADNARTCKYCGKVFEPQIASAPELPPEPKAPPEPPELSAFWETDTLREPKTLQEAATTSRTPSTSRTSSSGATSRTPSTTTSTSKKKGQYAPPKGSPQGFPPPQVASQRQARPTLSPPPPQSRPVQPAAPQRPPQPVIQQRPPQPTTAQRPAPRQPKSRWRTVVVLIIIATLLYAIGTNLDNFSFLWDTDSSRATEQPGGNSLLNEDDFNAGDILLSSDVVTIIINRGTEGFDEEYGWYQVGCTVENKTDKVLGLYFDYDTSIDGIGADELNIGILPLAYGEAAFPPNSVSEGIIMLGLPEPGATHLAGTLIVYEESSSEILKQYSVRMARL